MKVFLAAFAAFLIIVTSIFFYGYTIHKDLLQSREAAINSWSDLQGIFKKRTDIIPRFIEKTKGLSYINEVTLNTVVKAHRSVELVCTDLQAHQIANYKQSNEFQKMQNNLSKAINQFWLETENHPDFQPNIDLKTIKQELAALNQDILKQKKQFNETAAIYNKKVMGFPTAIVALMYGFERCHAFGNENLDPAIP
ncbi:MAG: LemA family protein [Deltaproteobacteria bacterium]|nr:LemA family protein [Deltaproteobacteria bacterium]